MADIVVIGGGLAGSECALQLADLGHSVSLYEMRPSKTTPVHKSDLCAELVCSNSLKSTKQTTAQGVLKEELQLMGSHLLELAYEHRVEAGHALAVDRNAFGKAVTDMLQAHPRIRMIREEVTHIPEGPCVIATGPVTSSDLTKALLSSFGPEEADCLAFYDAVAPIVDAESLNLDTLVAQSRYQKACEAGDYLNAFLTKSDYEAFVKALITAEKAKLHAFEKRELFSACQPIEEIAKTGINALRYGPLKPKGLVDPETAKEPYAAVQLRAENRERTAYNLVGFQTNLTFTEQRRVFALIPGLEHAHFFRHGVLHKNTFINAPKLTTAFFQSHARKDLYFAGQISGTEGYVEAIATGLVVARALSATLANRTLSPLPKTTALGSLLAYATNPLTTNYQPMHVNYGLVPPLKERLPKQKRFAAYGTRAINDMKAFLETHPDWSRAERV